MNRRMFLSLAPMVPVLQAAKLGATRLKLRFVTTDFY